jgi:hypothetical protein
MNPPDPTASSANRWERHHREIVELATHGNAGRAAMLLREHLTDVGCDPIAARAVVTGLTVVGALNDAHALIDRLSRCPICAKAWFADPAANFVDT